VFRVALIFLSRPVPHVYGQLFPAVRQALPHGVGFLGRAWGTCAVALSGMLARSVRVEGGVIWVSLHDALRAAIEAAAPSYWWQCCVLFETFDKADHLKTDSRG
jgi:hypothetical protein